MHVMMLAMDYPPAVFAGIGVHAHGLAKALSALGADVDVFVVPHAETIASAKYRVEVDGRITVYRFEFDHEDTEAYRSRNLPTRRELRDIIWNVSTANVLKPILDIALVAANTVLSSIAVVNPRPEYELRVTQMRENEQGGWFTEEDRSAIRALSGVRDVELSSVVTARTYENGEWRNDDGDGSTINRIYVYLSDISRHEAVEKWLRDTYAGQEYSVVNEYAEYERTEVAFVGLLWLLLVFLLVLLVLEAMVVSARLTGFVLAQRGNLRRLYGLGASAGTLIRAYSGQAERAAAWGMILTIVPSAALLWVLNKSEMYFLDLRPGVLAMNLGCAALLALSYILPVRLALKKAMRGIRAEER